MTLSATLGATVLTVFVGWRLLRASLFDPQFASTRGLRPGMVRAALLLLTTAAVIASFEALGSILVIALLTCPPAAARLVTQRLSSYVLLSAALGAAAGLLGYALATRAAPLVIGSAIDASGTVAAAAGAILVATAALKTLSTGPKSLSQNTP